jgi:hypothetical protein
LARGIPRTLSTQSDIEQGRISYAVLSFGGFLGMRNKLFAVPWDARRDDLS